jgi:hypothetical protein
MLVLIRVRGRLGDLPPEGQQAIADLVAKPIRLNEYDDAGTAELDFNDRHGHLHYIGVIPEFIKAASR